ncbi:Heat shock protein Hsp-12.2 [Thelohanellus kitauei]|uniref:Heat shock protein Hsp-12.2 n=1 Tax=Thelohanellus kitauei TaxID=669202 RepID=A0A0C2MZW7_THEKT|nr:Heat shock protein Hsp-12.2 [Thelohanellus kitauei]
MIRRLFRVAISSLGSSQKLQFRPFHLRRRYSPFLDFEEDRKFRLLLDVEDFHPGDIDVKVQDGKIKISAHKTSAYSNWRDSSQITREYDIPKDVDASTIKSHIDSGLLSIEGDRRVTGRNILTQARPSVLTTRKSTS